MKCSYCDEPFDQGADHKWGPYCSKACRHAVELPLSHAGQSWCSADLMGPEALDACALKLDDAGQSDTTIPPAIMDFMRDWLHLPPGQRDAVALVLCHPGEKLSDIHKQTGDGTTIQAFHRRLMSACEHLPYLAGVIRRYRPRKN